MTAQFDIVGPQPSQQEVEENRRATEEHVVPSFGSGDTFKVDPNYYRMANFLGLKDTDRLDSDIANKVSFIRDFTKEKSESDAMVKIRKMIRSLGISSQGKDLVTKLYAYTRLAKDREDIDKEISAYVDEKPKTNVAPNKIKVQVKQLKGQLEQSLSEKRRLVRKVNEVIKVLTK